MFDTSNQKSPLGADLAGLLLATIAHPIYFFPDNLIRLNGLCKLRAMLLRNKGKSERNGNATRTSFAFDVHGVMGSVIAISRMLLAAFALYFRHVLAGLAMPSYIRHLISYFTHITKDNQ